jgi:hypothetical protein
MNIILLGTSREEYEVQVLGERIESGVYELFKYNVIIPNERRTRVCDPFSRAPHRRLVAMGCGRRTRRSLPSMHLFSAG